MPSLKINGQEIFHYSKEQLEEIRRDTLDSLRKQVNDIENRLKRLEKKESRGKWINTKNSNIYEYLLLLDPFMTTTVIVPEDRTIESVFKETNRNVINHKIVKIIAKRRRK